MSENCYVIFIFPIYSQFGEIQKPDSERIVCKTYVFINSNLLSYKNENKTKKSLAQLEALFLPKNGDCLRKMLTLAKLREFWY